AWVGEGKPKPVSAMAFDSVTLNFNKLAGIVPITVELMRFSAPSAELLIRNSLVHAITKLVDTPFLDPAVAAVTGVSPASVTNGVTAIPSTGTTPEALRADLYTLLATYASANQSTDGLVLVMRSSLALGIGMSRNAFGIKEFPDMTKDGGSLEGIPGHHNGRRLSVWHPGDRLSERADRAVGRDQRAHDLDGRRRRRRVRRFH